MPRRLLTAWIIGTVVPCAVLGAFLGQHVGDGGIGNIALISATCAVPGSFLPGGVLRLRTRFRGHGQGRGAT